MKSTTIDKYLKNECVKDSLQGGLKYGYIKNTENIQRY